MCSQFIVYVLDFPVFSPRGAFYVCVMSIYQSIIDSINDFCECLNSLQPYI